MLVLVAKNLARYLPASVYGTAQRLQRTDELKVQEIDATTKWSSDARGKESEEESVQTIYGVKFSSE